MVSTKTAIEHHNLNNPLIQHRTQFSQNQNPFSQIDDTQSNYYGNTPSGVVVREDFMMS
jgi:hypothetical protein